MKIEKHGHVIIAEGKRTVIEGFTCTREESDPIDAHASQLVAAAAVEWALKKLQKEYNDAMLAGLIKSSAKIKAKQAEKGKPN